MKKKLLVFLSVVFILACVFALSVSAETSLKPQATNAYGELSFFDESISVGRTNTSYGFTPYMDAEGTTYARIVVGNGTTFYTFPTAYALSNSAIYGSGQKSIMVLDLASLNSAMQTATGTNPNWSKTNVYRIELPKNMQYLNAGNQNFSGWSNVIEIYLQPESTLKDTNKNMVFWKCHNLETIHNLDTFVFRSGSLGGAFQECKKLTNITIGVSTEITTTGDNIFNGCTNLQSINFKEAFPNLTTIGKSAFYGCNNLKKISSGSEDYTFVMADTVTTIGTNAFDGCKLLETVYVGTNVATLSNDAFRNCPNLNTIYVTDKIVSIKSNTFKDSNNVKTVFYVGTKANAESFINTANSSGGNTVIDTLTLISCSDYEALENKEGQYLIYDYNYCEAYNKGIHELDAEKSNACAGVCTVCGEKSLSANPEHNYVTVIVYTNYLANGTKTQACQNEGCAHNTTPVESAVNPIISEFKGISVKEEGDGLSFGYVIDYEALDEYVAVNGDVELGFVVAAKAFLVDKQPLDENGNAASDKVIKATIYDSSKGEEGSARYTGADFKLTGTWDGNVDLDGDEEYETPIKDVVFYMAGYIIDGNVSYINANESSDTADSFSYSEAENA